MDGRLAKVHHLETKRGAWLGRERNAPCRMVVALGGILLILLGLAGAGAAWAWARLFWEQLDPKIRQRLGRRWGVVIIWEHSDERTGWGIRGDEHGMANRVAVASVLVWLLGFFMPVAVVVGGVEVGLISALPGLLLVLSTVFVSFWAWRSEISRLGQPSHEPPESAEESASAPVASPLRHRAAPGTDTLSSYLTALGCIGASVVLSFLLRSVAELEDLVMIHLLGIVLLSMLCSVGLSVAAASVMVVSFDYLFVPPAFSFAQAELKHSLTFAVMILVAGVVSGLQQRFRREERAAHEAAFRARTLYELERQLSSSATSNSGTKEAVRTLEASFESKLELVLGRPSERLPSQLSAEQLVLAEQAFCQRELVRDAAYPQAGVWTPLLGKSGCLGVLGFHTAPADDRSGIWDDLFEACASRLATSIESVQLGEAARRSELEAETERMRSSLLSAVSHDLKTPLSSILAAATTLLERRGDLEEQAFDELLAAVVLEAERLSRLVHDLLSITRLESSGIVLTKTAESIEEIVTVAVQRLEAQGVDRQIRYDFDKELPLVLVDPTLIEQVLINLMTNAVRYAGAQSPIELSAQVNGDEMLVRVADRGPGVPLGERSRVFDKFYRSPSVASADGGIGLGLTICRAIVTAHGGTIAIRERDGGGASVEFTLPTLTSNSADLGAGSAGR